MKINLIIRFKHRIIESYSISHFIILYGLVTIPFVLFGLRFASNLGDIPIKTTYTIFVCWLAFIWKFFDLRYEIITRSISISLVLVNADLLFSYPIYINSIFNLFNLFNIIIFMVMIYITIKEINQIIKSIFSRFRKFSYSSTSSKKDILILVFLVTMLVTIVIVIPIQYEKNRHIPDADATVEHSQQKSEISDDTYNLSVTVLQFDYADYLVVYVESNNRVKLNKTGFNRSNIRHSPKISSKPTVNQDKNSSTILCSLGEKAVFSGLSEGDTVEVYAIKSAPNTTAKNILQSLKLGRYANQTIKKNIIHIFRISEE
jgi:hypothetical protein